jgi:hypothetical protein
MGLGEIEEGCSQSYPQKLCVITAENFLFIDEAQKTRSLLPDWQ